MVHNQKEVLNASGKEGEWTRDRQTKRWRGENEVKDTS